VKSKRAGCQNSQLFCFFLSQGSVWFFGSILFGLYTICWGLEAIQKIGSILFVGVLKQFKK